MKKLLISFLLTFILIVYSAKAEETTHIYEALSVDLNALKHVNKIQIYPVIDTSYNYFKVSFREIVKGEYIPDLEENSHHFSQPFSQTIHNVLCYVSNKKPTKPLLVISLNSFPIKRIFSFPKDTKRDYSKEEYKKTLEQIQEDHKIKEQNTGTLVELSKEYTILNANKYAFIDINDSEYDILLSYYETHGWEYSAKVYVIDFLLDGKVVLTKEKMDWDGPY